MGIQASRLRIRHGTQGHTHPTHEEQEDARALLLSHERLRFFCELMGAKVSRVQAALLTAAGLPSPRPLGEAHGAVHRLRPRNTGGRAPGRDPAPGGSSLPDDHR
jgi:hypothetical protein